MPWITLPEPKYPLTESEKKWLHKRKNIKGWAFCLHCPPSKNGFPCTNWLYNLCPTEHRSQDFEDAAEFEARVAASIAQDAYNCAQDEMLFQHQEGDRPQGWYILRDARLVVEEEMENGRTV